MKNKKNGVSTGLIFAGLSLLSNNSFAGLNNKFKEYVGDGSSNFASLYIIAGVIAVGIIGKLVQHYLMKEDVTTSPNVKISHHSHHNHHRHNRHRAVVKKTS
jgi:hypothetical protein